MTDTATARAPRGTLRDLDAELAAIPDLAWADLRQRWIDVTGRPVPRVKQTLLRLALAWELQASLHGGVSPRALKVLGRLGETSPSPAHTGKTLVREWKGVLHTVTVHDDGMIHWNGKTWKSLSEVARAITGTRWSGPVFFGLKPRGRAA
ncbi:MAG: hypothetical protein RIS94_2205 [Pseudomonadota bacterium]|jgi:hypothetical protein